MGLATVAAMHPRARQWHYAQLKGLPFGLASSVNQLSRVAAFDTAACRHLLHSLCGNDVDVVGLLEMYSIAHCSSSAASCASTRADFMGVKYSSGKSQLPAFMVNFLGHLHDLCRAAWPHRVLRGPRLSTRETVTDLIDHAFSSRRLSSGEASKLRGLCTWLDSSLPGRALHGALYALTARHYWGTNTKVEPGDTLEISPQHLRAAARAVPGRSLALLAPTQRPVLLYTDASASGLKVRIGALLVVDDDEFFCTAHDPDDDIAASWKCRRDSEGAIAPAELYAVLVALQTFKVHLRGRGILWLVDGQAAGTCFVKAGSQVPALPLLALRVTSSMGALGCRVWAEFIPSADNVADPLSRYGLDHGYVATKIAAGAWRCVPPCCEAAVSSGWVRL